MKREQQKNHRATCATRLVQFDADSGEPFNCGLPCDCDNPQRWVEVPVGDATPPAPGEDARLKQIIGNALLPLGSVRRRIIAARASNPASAGWATAQDKIDQVINVFEAALRGTTPRPESALNQVKG